MFAATLKIKVGRLDEDQLEFVAVVGVGPLIGGFGSDERGSRERSEWRERFEQVVRLGAWLRLE